MRSILKIVLGFLAVLAAVLISVGISFLVTFAIIWACCWVVSLILGEEVLSLQYIVIVSIVITALQMLFSRGK